MATPVVGDDAIAVRQEDQLLVVPVFGRQRPAMMKHDRLSILGTLALEEDLRSVIRGDVAAAHLCSSFWTVSCILRGRRAGKRGHGRQQRDIGDELATAELERRSERVPIHLRSVQWFGFTT